MFHFGPAMAHLDLFRKTIKNYNFHVPVGLIHCSECKSYEDDSSSGKKQLLPINH